MMPSYTKQLFCLGTILSFGIFSVVQAGDVDENNDDNLLLRAANVLPSSGSTLGGPGAFQGNAGDSTPILVNGSYSWSMQFCATVVNKGTAPVRFTWNARDQVTTAVVEPEGDELGRDVVAWCGLLGTRGEAVSLTGECLDNGCTFFWRIDNPT